MPTATLPPATTPKAIKVHWVSSDGLFGVITAKDMPPGIGRSRTRDTEIDAANAPWEAGLTHQVGPGSRNKFIKVRLADLGVPVQHNPTTGGGGTLGPALLDTLKPKNYAQPGKKFIPDYPHTCTVCGGRMLQLFTSQEHEGGVCPGPKKPGRAR